MKKLGKGDYRAVVIGASAGGLAALDTIISAFPVPLTVPLFVVQHISPTETSYLAAHFRATSMMKVKEGEDKESPEPGTIYIAPPNYHLMLEQEGTIALSTEERVHFSRPSIDVLFETAAEAYRDRLIAVILTGANSDGANGLARVKHCGGLAVVQSPETAEVATMPQAAINTTRVDHILPLEEIGPLLNTLVGAGDSI